MKRYKRINTIVLLSLLLFSCKKNKSVIQEPILNQIDSKYVSASFTFGKLIQVNSKSNINVQNVISGGVLFYSRPMHIDSINPYSRIDVGNVFINNIMLRTPQIGYYYDSTGLIPNPPFQMYNNRPFKNSEYFSFLYNQPIPDYTGFMSLPDTLYASKSNYIKIKNFTNCNQVKVLLGNGWIDGLNKNLKQDDSIISFIAPYDQMALPIFEAHRTQIKIIFTLSNIRRFNNKFYYFETALAVDVSGLPIVE
jgi:hypothetical protein